MSSAEEKLAGFAGKVGALCGWISLMSLGAFAASEILMRYFGMDREILRQISQYAPGIAASFGGVSTVIGYYGYVRIARRKAKLNLKDEGKGEGQSQLADFLQSLPDTLSQMPGCASQASNAMALGASLTVSAVVYIPEVNEIFHETVESITEYVAPAKSEPPPIQIELKKFSIKGKLNIAAAHAAHAAHGKKSMATVELLQNGSPIRTVQTDEEGNYIFEDVPQDSYSIRATLEGFEDGYAQLSLGEDTQLPEMRLIQIEEEEDPLEGIYSGEMPGPDGAYVIQANSYDTQQQATKALFHLAMNGVPAYTARASDGKYRVRIGSFRTEKSAKNYGASTLPPLGHKNWWVDSKKNDNVKLVKAPSEEAAPSGEPASRRPLVLLAPPPPIPSPAPAQYRPPPVERRAPRQPEPDNSGFYIGAGSELNNNAQKGTAVGWNATIGYDISKSVAVGASAVYSSDMNSASTIEPTLAIRYYPIEGPFLQAEAGGALKQDGSKSALTPLYGTAAGWKLGMDGNWYLEPAVRVGYPMVWGTGIKVGKKFGAEKQ